MRYDRTRGLFHPNAEGHSVLACAMLASYVRASTADCNARALAAPDTVNGVPLWLRVITTKIHESMALNVGGFAPNSGVHLVLRSNMVDLGDVTTDADGRAIFSVEIPDVAPGVHRLEMSGVGADGVQVVKEAMVEIPGDPAPGESYGVYLTGFDAGDPATGTLEYVDITYLGTHFTVLPDAAGGIFLELPVPNNSGVVDLTAVSQLTGETVSQTLTIDNPNDLTVSAWRAPWKQAPAWNTATVGQAVNVQFRVLDGQGHPVRDRALIDLRNYAIDCQTGADLGGYTTPPSHGWTGLKYLGNGWWQADVGYRRGGSGNVPDVLRRHRQRRAARPLVHLPPGLAPVEFVAPMAPVEPMEPVALAARAVRASLGSLSAFAPATPAAPVRRPSSRALRIRARTGRGRSSWVGARPR